MIEAILELARPAVREMRPYSSARSLSTEGSVFLDANENPWGDYNRYPEPQPERLRRQLAELYGVSADQLFLGGGADDAIDSLIRTFCEAGKDQILIAPPTYGVYEVAARIQGARIKEVPQVAERGFEPSPAAILDAWEPGVKLVFLCSPNNPTGNWIPTATLEAIARGLGGRSLLVIDEAYIEFSGQPSFCHRLGEYPNVVVLRTLSKAWALAGARCGVAIGRREIIGLLQKVRAPYPIGTPSVTAALAALTPEGRSLARSRTRALVLERENLREALGLLPFVERVYPSDANFLLIKVRSAERVMAICRKRGIVLRDRSQDYGLRDCIRISIGSPEENQLLLQVLREVSA
jgi:histidinol-phosphate aminotransferase